jgi:hypothetical protein
MQLFCKVLPVLSVISGFSHKVDDNCALLSYCAASSGNLFPIFQDNPLVPSSGFKNPKQSLLPQYRVYIGKSVGGEKCQQCGVSQ